MAGLESIALAVAHLERAAKQESTESNDVAKLATAPPTVDLDAGLKATLLPARTVFNELTARRVSSDSICETNSPQSTSHLPFTVPAPECPNLLPTMSSDMVSLSLESLSEPECAGPPPPPPLPSDVITEVMESDVLCGRGGETNHHPGNVKYRSLVKRYQPLYIVSKRRDKPRIAEKIVHTIRHRGGRFLKKDSHSLTWRDVGNTKAREKTSQALREGAPELRTTPKGKEDHPSESALAVQANQTCYAVPSIVEMQPGDTLSSSPMKRRRLEGVETARLPPVPMPSGQLVLNSPLPIQTKAHFISPNSFAATVSADDEDYRLEERPVREKSQDLQPSIRARGPRLKLLKKRLQNAENP